MAIQLFPPVNGPITQLFGEDPQFYKRFGFPGHNGIDYGIPNGTSIAAAAAGTVAAISFENGGYGNYIKLGHMDGSRKYFTYYAHLSGAAVTPGQQVEAGNIIGFSDNTGATDAFPDAVELPDLPFVVTFPTLNVRNGPGVEYSIIGQLTQGTRITGSRLRSKSVWIEFESGKWCALAFNGSKFLELESD